MMSMILLWHRNRCIMGFWNKPKNCWQADWEKCIPVSTCPPFHPLFLSVLFPWRSRNRWTLTGRAQIHRLHSHTPSDFVFRHRTSGRSLCCLYFVRTVNIYEFSCPLRVVFINGAFDSCGEEYDPLGFNKMPKNLSARTPKSWKVSTVCVKIWTGWSSYGSHRQEWWYHFAKIHRYWKMMTDLARSTKSGVNTGI